MYSRRSNVSEYVSPSHDDGRGYYFGDASSASTAAVAPMPQRHSDRRSYSPIGRSGIYEIQPYISSADVHVFPESITVTPGRKTIMVGRKESPQMVPRQYQYLGSPYNANEGLEDGDFRLSGAGRRPDMVYKTTMITQVTPREASSGRDSPLRQSPQHGRQDSRLFHISVEPTSPSSQPEYVRYSSSPEAVQRSSAMRKSQSNSDWSGQGQTHYLQCSPDQRLEISFQHRLPTQSNQGHQFYRDRSPQAVGLREQFFRPDQQQWRGHGEFGDSFLQSPRPQSRTPPPEPQAVPSRLVYSPQTPNQSIAYSKKVEKKTPSHCSSIMIVPGGGKKATEEEGSGRQQNSEAKDQKTGFLQSVDGSKVDKEAEIDELTNLLVQNMQMTGHPEFFGMCSSCGRAIMGTANGCSALGRLYHVTCFICGVCRIPLKQKPFFSLDGVTFCEHCYSTTVERCSECNEPITEKMLRAVGKQYHPGCFKCCSCRTSLDGRAFTLDAGGKVLCLEDFNRKYAPRCTGCGKMIVPLEGKGEAERVVVLDRNYHLECHRCEDCGKHLSSRFGGEGCFPLDDSILCGRCNAHRMERLTNPGSTNV